MRQENTELRHRVRQSTSRSARSGNTGNASFVSAIHSPGEAIENAATVNADLAAANRKLRRQVEDLKKELTISAEEIEKTKRECAKEVMKWKKKISGKNNSDFDEIQKSRSRQESEMVVDLRKTILSLERELKLERLNKGLPSSRTGSSSRLSTADWNSSIAVQSFSARNASSRRASSASLSTRETQSRNQKNNRSRSMSPLERNPELHKSRNSTVAIITSRNAKNYVPARRETPPRRSTQGKDYSPSQQFSPSSSSSLGKRFDPTAYNLAKETRSRSTTKAWGAGSSTLNSKHRYESPSESGYSSSNSQVRFSSSFVFLIYKVIKNLDSFRMKSSYNSRRSDRSNSERDKKKKKSTTTRKQEKQAELKMIGNRAESPKLKTIPADNTYASNDLNAKANRMHSTFQTLKPSTR